MDNNDLLLAVRKMQSFIEKSFEQEITLVMLGEVAGYSPWHSAMLFKRYTSKSPYEYIRLLRLSKAALRLRDENIKILEVALDSEYDSHEGFTRAFNKHFGMTPTKYLEELPPIKLFFPYLVELEKGESESMKQKEICPVFIKVEKKPLRKMIIKRGIKANDYFEYCEEVGCDIWGLLLSVKEAVSEPVGMWMPDRFIKLNTSKYCQGVEVPIDYNKVLPEGLEIIELPECEMLIFQGPKFKDEDYGEAIESMIEVINNYDPKIIGYSWDINGGPRMQYEPRGNRGYIELLPVVKR